jgi:hypothetical protein
LPLEDDAARVLPRLDGIENPPRADQRQCFIQLEIIRIQLPEGGGELDAEGGRIKRLAVQQQKLNAVADLAGK